MLDYNLRFKLSWVYDELYRARNFGPAMHKLVTFLGAAFNFIDQNIFRGRLPITIRDNSDDYAQLENVHNSDAISYPKPDSVFSFDKLSSVILSNTNHEEDQPCHLLLEDENIHLGTNLSQLNEPAQRYCPAGVYEIIDTDEGQAFQIISQNCLHCKTCDIKDPAQNISWTTPEGGPNYPNM